MQCILVFAPVLAIIKLKKLKALPFLLVHGSFGKHTVSTSNMEGIEVVD